MRITLKFTILFFCIVTLLSCNTERDKQIMSALSIVDKNPDSTLAAIDKMDYSNLSSKELALCCLAYTIAQDKMGIKVDNDSLIRKAYNWYKNRPEDSLYAKSQYYMGRYYMNNDSTEKAVSCFEIARKCAVEQRDSTLACLAMEKLSKLMRLYDPKKALDYARTVVVVYDRLKDANVSNKIYSRLNLCKCYEAVDSFSSALALCRSTLEIALKTGDSLVISDTYQDLSSFYDNKKDKEKALIAIKEANKFNVRKNNTSLQFSLVSAYIEMDSLEKATMLLREIVARRAIDKYALFYYQAKTANKGGNIEKATVYADSSRHYLEQMYCDAIGAKTKYYESNLKKEKEKMKLENNSNRHQAIMLMVVTVLFFIVLFIYYFYYSSKKQNKIKMEMADKLHKEEISHKEIQLSVMRNYLIKKIDVVRKLEKLSAGKSSNHKILLSDEDWEELETFLNGVESMFVKRLRVGFPQLREKDIRLMMLLRINIPQKMLADIYCISEKAVKQKLFLYKSKVGIQGDKMSLREFIESF